MRSHATRDSGELDVHRVTKFQYRKRYEVTCDLRFVKLLETNKLCFNTASGMRSHATGYQRFIADKPEEFQYRKRYEVTCDLLSLVLQWELVGVSIPQAV